MGPALTLALVALIWGATFVVVKRALDDISPLLYLSLRFSLAAGTLALLFRRRIRLGFGRQELWAGLWTGAMLMTGYVLQTVGLQWTTPAKSAFLTGLYIVLVPFAAWAVYRNRPRTAEVAGALVAGLGMALLALNGEKWSSGWGEALTVACAGAFAVHIVLLGHWAPRYGFESLSMLQIAAAAAVATVATPVLEQPFVRWTPSVIGAIVAGGLLATALAFVLQTWAQQRISPARAAVLFSLEPVFAWLVSWVVEGEVLSAQGAAGAACILGGILMVELKPAPAPAHPLS